MVKGVKRSVEKPAEEKKGMMLGATGGRLVDLLIVAFYFLFLSLSLSLIPFSFEIKYK